MVRHGVEQGPALRPRSLARAVRHSAPARVAAGSALDLLDRVRGRHDPLVPPRRKIFVGAGDYRAIGNEFKRLFVDLGGLRSTDDVLDVGCGIGRMAVPLAGWLSGRYEGFDVVASGVDWCRREITPRYPNFRFEVADVGNGRYNRAGGARPGEYRFPYDDASFDFAFATSLFTHLLPDAVENYLAEIARVLRGGGKSFSTFFLLEPGSADVVETDDYRFVRAGGYWTTSPRVPETGVAYERLWVEAALARAGLELRLVRRGSWIDPAGPTLQDVVVAGL